MRISARFVAFLPQQNHIYHYPWRSLQHCRHSNPESLVKLTSPQHERAFANARDGLMRIQTRNEVLKG